MKKKIEIILWVALILIICFFFYKKYNDSHHHFQVTFFDIGQGDSALIQFANGEKMLVDCGPDRKVLSKLGQTLPFYDRTIDYVLATHPDLDHYGGCVDVLKNYKVKQIIINGHKKNDPYFRAWDQAIKNEGAIVKVMSSPEEWVIASSTLHFISPDSSLHLDVPADDSNDYSIVFKLVNGRTSYLFTGDMEQLLEKAIVQKYCSTTSTCSTIQANVLKVGHHGSGSSSGEDFLNLVQPQTAIVSVGKKNTYGHPSLRVLRKLERVGAEILRTDQKGDIMEP